MYLVNWQRNSIAAVGKSASTVGTVINVGVNLYDGNYVGAAQESVAFIGGSAASAGIKKLGMGRVRGAKGRYVKNEWGGSKAARDAKQETVNQVISKPLSQPIC